MSEKDLQVSELGEKKLIKRIINKLSKYQEISYIGDDAALINLKLANFDENSYLVATSDLLIQSSHFPKQMSYFQMGWKAVTANVSDLAAMGAKPTSLLISLAIPNSLKLNYFDEIIDGIFNACSYYNIPLVGGDTNQSDQIIISGTALGEVEKVNVLKKSGFNQGDLIAITGNIGLAGLGVELFKSQKNINKVKNGLSNKKITQKMVDLAIESALEPKAKTKEGIFLSNFASSATDITDGLASELYELFNSDKNNNIDTDLGLKIYEDKLLKNTNFAYEYYAISELLKVNPLELILHIGEDFELLFTFNKDKFDDFNNHANENVDSIDFYVIGEVNNSNMVEIEYSNGITKKLSSKGYEHLGKNKNKG